MQHRLWPFPHDTADIDLWDDHIRQKKGREMCLVCDCVNVNDAVGTAVIKDRYLTFSHSLFKASTAWVSFWRPAISATKHDAALLEVDTASPFWKLNASP